MAQEQFIPPDRSNLDIPYVSTCLWFADQAEEAANYYVGLVKNSYLTQRGPLMEDGKPSIVGFNLSGASYSAINGGPIYRHSPAASIVVTPEDQDETDALWDGLLAGGGKTLTRGWVQDRFGISWQVVPKPIIELMISENQEAIAMMMRHMMGMDRLIITELEAAFRS